MNQTPARIAIAAGLALGAATLLADAASAMPAIDGGAAAVAGATTHIEPARWVCGPYRCWRRPGPYWGPRYYYGPGWRWRRWHRRWW
jgi:hypothetical protein